MQQVQIHQIVYNKYVQFFVHQLYLNKSVNFLKRQNKKLTFFFEEHGKRIDVRLKSHALQLKLVHLQIQLVHVRTKSQEVLTIKLIPLHRFCD